MVVMIDRDREAQFQFILERSRLRRKSAEGEEVKARVVADEFATVRVPAVTHVCDGVFEPHLGHVDPGVIRGSVDAESHRVSCYRSRWGYSWS